MSTTSSTEQLVADLYAVDGKAEIVDGRIVMMSPTGGKPGRSAVRIYLSLLQYESQVPGYAYPDNVGFVVDLPDRKSFSPDASFAIQEPEMSFVKGAPLFAAEIRSENDYGPAAEQAMAAKRADYFAAGTKVVWDVNLLSEDVVHVYRAENPEEPTVYRKGEAAAAEPAVPGWTMPVDALFE
ncbi:MAG: Uma2 family endonuclease [Pirellulales bacterium]|nr:Uma2 family endonuclease [Pirellulales bacterium]